MTTATTIEPGIHTMERAEYDAIDAVSASLLLAGPTMAHRKAWIDGHRETTDAQRFGIAMHCFLLEPERFAQDYYVCKTPPDRRSNWGKAYWQDIETSLVSDHNGDDKAAAKEAEKRRKAASADWDAKAKAYGADKMIDAPELATFEAMRKVLHGTRRRSVLAQTPGRYECVILWTDKDTGLACKGMLDKLIDDLLVVVDLKRAISADPEKFGVAASVHGYDQRAAFYVDGLLAITGKQFDYALLAQEPDYPYLPATYEIRFGDDNYMAGRIKYRNTLNSVAQCMRSGEWPGYGDEVMPLMMPKWAYPQFQR